MERWPGNHGSLLIHKWNDKTQRTMNYEQIHSRFSQQERSRQSAKSKSAIGKLAIQEPLASRQ